MIIGYARVSTDEQRLDMQLSALKEAGCEKIFQDQGATGANMERQGLDAVLQALTPGDTLVVWRLDRLGRSLTDLVKFIEDLGEAGCEFRSLNEAIDTSTSGGRLIFHIMAAFAEFERNLISERTRAGLAAARKRGRRLGRPPTPLSDTDLENARRAISERKMNIQEIAARYRISPSTLRRRLNVARAQKSDSIPQNQRLAHLTASPKRPSPARMRHLCSTSWTNSPSHLSLFANFQKPAISHHYRFATHMGIQELPQGIWAEETNTPKTLRANKSPSHPAPAVISISERGCVQLYPATHIAHRLNDYPSSYCKIFNFHRIYYTVR